MKRPSIDDNKFKGPGPQYDIPQILFKDAPKYGMGAKGSDSVGKHLAQNPGPG
jgi:hypothetical protein